MANGGGDYYPAKMDYSEAARLVYGDPKDNPKMGTSKAMELDQMNKKRVAIEQHAAGELRKLADHMLACGYDPMTVVPRDIVDKMLAGRMSQYAPQSGPNSAPRRKLRTGRAAKLLLLGAA